MVQLHITRSKSRRFRCDIAGCRNFTNIFVSKRRDLSARPLHLCESCIRGLNQLLDETAHVREIVPPDEIPTEAEAEFLKAAVSEPEPKRKPKSESKPNRAKGGKGGGK